MTTEPPALVEDKKFNIECFRRLIAPHGIKSAVLYNWSSTVSPSELWSCIAAVAPDGRRHSVSWQTPRQPTLEEVRAALPIPVTQGDAARFD